MQPSITRERALWARGLRYVAGVDEAGRGSLAGPVVAAAVILPPHALIECVNDSKVLNGSTREELARVIEDEATSIGIGMCSPAEVDEMNVLHASMEAMRRAADALSPAPDFLLIDGNRCFPDSDWPFETVVRGDANCHAIAAASVVAKVTRDRLMRELHLEYPAYGWHSNVGYPTLHHYAALAEFGPTRYHRRTFRLA